MAEAKKQEVAEQSKPAGLVEYEANGELVKLSYSTVKKYLVSGGGNVSDQEVMMFLSLCRYQHLNPFLKEAHLIKYGSNDPATIVVGKDVFTKRANATPTYGGKQAGVIVLDKSGEIKEREGALVLPGETLVGGWAKVFIKGHDTPEYASVSFEEYVGRKKSGEINGQWSKKPATMIRKVAVVQALREAFPDRFQGMYAQEEFPEVSGAKLDTEEVVARDIAENANSELFVAADFNAADADSAEPEKVTGEVVENDENVPEFMKD